MRNLAISATGPILLPAREPLFTYSSSRAWSHPFHQMLTTLLIHKCSRPSPLDSPWRKRHCYDFSVLTGIYESNLVTNPGSPNQFCRWLLSMSRMPRELFVESLVGNGHRNLTAIEFVLWRIGLSWSQFKQLTAAILACHGDKVYISIIIRQIC